MQSCTQEGKKCATFICTFIARLAAFTFIVHELVKPEKFECVLNGPLCIKKDGGPTGLRKPVSVFLKSHCYSYLELLAYFESRTRKMDIMAYLKLCF